MQNEERISFLKHEDCFYNKISCILKLEKRQRDPSYVMHTRFDDEDRKSLGQLRLRKQHRKVASSNRPQFQVQEKIQKLKDMDENQAKLAEIQRKSRSKASQRKIQRNIRKEKNKSLMENRVYSSLSMRSDSNSVQGVKTFVDQPPQLNLSKVLNNQCQLAISTRTPQVTSNRHAL